MHRVEDALSFFDARRGLNGGANSHNIAPRDARGAMRLGFSNTLWIVVGLMVGLLLTAPIQSSYAAAQQRIEGTISDSLGRPIAGAEVNLKTADGHLAASAVTDKDGKFVLHAAPGNFELTARMADFNPAAMPVVVAAGKPSPPVTLAMISSNPLTLQVLAPRFDRA